MYKMKQQETHHGFTIEKSGLRINPMYPHIGASADAVVSCHCCGKGVLEIKCPFCARDQSISQDNVKCLEEVDGELKLRKEHEYFYQCQMQLYVYDVTYCDFVVWTQKDKEEPFIERIIPDAAFFTEQMAKVSLFYTKVVLPNLLAKIILAPIADLGQRLDDICLCREPPSGEMLECKSGMCKIVNYHKACMKLVKVPKRYICPACRTIINKQKRDQKKMSVKP